jgi:hypothetical protein
LNKLTSLRLAREAATVKSGIHLGAAGYQSPSAQLGEHFTAVAAGVADRDQAARAIL